MWTFKMEAMGLPVLILCLSLHHAHQYKIANVETSGADNHFDFIILSQEWPVTVCMYYKYVLNPRGNCILPEKRNRWTIHGIWPRKIKGIYPEFCNESWPFDPEQIRSIEGDLNQAEIQVYKEDKPYTFWAHEWRRHGTCATVLEPFDTQLKYFSKSIELNHKYRLSDMLEAANIFPSDTTYLDPEDILNAVKATTGKKPTMGCYIIKRVSYLQELRICLDKQLNLIDCNGRAIDKYCRSSKGFIYPANQ